eukprot:312963_1
MSCNSVVPTAVVTGASKGIGRGIAISLIENGWNVCMIARRLDKMKRNTAKYDNKNNRIKLIKCDVVNPSEILETCKQIKSWSNDNINLLVNNVGGGGAGFGQNLETTKLKNWEYTMNLNVRSTFLFSQQLTSSLKNAAKTPCKYNDNIYDASIVNLSSIAGVESASYNALMSYSVSKAAVNQLTKLNALELSKYKIRVNALLPGFIPTWRMPNPEDQEKMLKNAVKRYPIGRIGKVDDIVQMVAFLSNKNQSGWITGQLIRMDGGSTLLSSSL